MPAAGLLRLAQGTAQTAPARDRAQGVVVEPVGEDVCAIGVVEAGDEQDLARLETELAADRINKGVKLFGFAAEGV